jgi:hypothetical protein
MATNKALNWTSNRCNLFGAEKDPAARDECLQVKIRVMRERIELL